MSLHYYNEIHPGKAEVIKNMITRGMIPAGDVDTRDIQDVTPSDLAGYTSCHFFAGIAIWALAFRAAGWPDDRPVWSGSCPCQPFSTAGKGDGFDDERHLWPAWHYLIQQCRPDAVFAEQVASKDGLAWLDLVQTDMEVTQYAGGFLDLCAAGFGAPQIRQRLYGHYRRPTARWVGDRGGAGLEGYTGHVPDGYKPGRLPAVTHRPAAEAGAVGGLARAGGVGQQQARRGLPAARRPAPAGCGATERDDRPGPTNGFWAAADWLACRDQKWRPVECGTFPLAYGTATRNLELLSYGDGIVLPQAVEFVKAVMAC